MVIIKLHGIQMETKEIIGRLPVAKDSPMLTWHEYI